MYQSVYSLYLYRNDEERKNVMNRLKRRQFGVQKQQQKQQQRRQQRRQYHKRNDDDEPDSEPNSETEPVKPVERLPFNGERDIKKCYF